MSDILEEDDKNSYEDLEEIAAENFDEFSRNVNDLFLSDERARMRLMRIDTKLANEDSQDDVF